MIFSYVTFKMAALWFWTMFNCNPPISPCYPLIWGGGILADHWSTISSFTRYSFSEITCSCQDHKISKNASILTNKVRDKSKSTWMWRFAQWMHHEVHGGGKIAQPSALGFCLYRKWNGAFMGQNITPMWLWDQQVLVFPGDLTIYSIQAWINNTKWKQNESNETRVTETVCQTDWSISRVSCQKGPISHAWACRVGPFWQDTLDMWAVLKMDVYFSVSGKEAKTNRFSVEFPFDDPLLLSISDSNFELGFRLHSIKINSRLDHPQSHNFIKFIISLLQWSWMGVYLFHLVCPSIYPSVCLWMELCPLCIFNNTCWIHFIFIILSSNFRRCIVNLYFHKAPNSKFLTKFWNL